MRIFIIAALTLSVCALQPLLLTYKETALKNLATTMRSKQPSFESLFGQLQVAQATKVQLDLDDVCSFLKKAETSTLSQREAYFYLKSANSIGDCKIARSELPGTVKTFTEDFNEFYYNQLYALESGQSALCDRLNQFVGKNGAAKLKSNKPDDNYEAASRLYHLALECIERGQDNGVISLIEVPAQTALVNLQELYLNNRAFPERENTVPYKFICEVVATARFISVFLDLLPKFVKLRNVAAVELEKSIIQHTVLNFLRSKLNEPRLCATEQYWVLRALRSSYLRNVVVPQFVQQVYFYSNQVQLQVRFTDIFGERVDAPEGLSAKLLDSSSNVLQRDLQFQASLSKGKDYSGFIEVNHESLKTLGRFFVEVEVNNQGTKFTYSDSVQLGTRVKILDLNFDVVHNKQDSPEFEHNVDEREFYPTTLEADESSFLHVIFRLQYDKGLNINAQQVAVRLIHPEYSQATFFVPAQYDSKKDSYYVLFDFGDPEHILPHDALYKVEVLVADARLVENKRWTFAQVLVNFSTPSKGQPASELDYNLPPVIIHQFAPPAAEVPALFVLSFCAVMVLAFLFYLKMLSTLNLNTDRLPENPLQQLLTYGFFGLILAVFGVLLLFWVVLNLIETLTVLAVVLVPLFLVGNFALVSLKQ